MIEPRLEAHLIATGRPVPSTVRNLGSTHMWLAPDARTGELLPRFARVDAAPDLSWFAFYDLQFDGLTVDAPAVLAWLDELGETGQGTAPPPVPALETPVGDPDFGPEAVENICSLEDYWRMMHRPDRLRRGVLVFDAESLVKQRINLIHRAVREAWGPQHPLVVTAVAASVDDTMLRPAVASAAVDQLLRGVPSPPGLSKDVETVLLRLAAAPVATPDTGFFTASERADWDTWSGTVVEARGA